jgi:2-polyprenyl-6-methoxyphenol hydroxylase-like FAD-dependent oxidoreductase
MRFVIAGGGFAGLSAALALGRRDHQVLLVERDVVDPATDFRAAFAAERNGIPHYLQPHSFLPRGRRVLLDSAPDIYETLIEVGADPQDLAEKLRGPREAGDEDLVYLWVRRPVIEWALRHAVVAEPNVEVRTGIQVRGLELSGDASCRAIGVAVDGGEVIDGDVVVDALGRYRCPTGWPRPRAEPSDTGAIYYCRYFELAPGVEHMDAPILNPRGDLGYMGFNTFRGDNRTFAVILLAPSRDRALRILRHESVWEEACRMITPLDAMTSPDYGRPITEVMPMGGLMNVERTSDPTVRGLVAVGDALCHTDPAFAYGLSFALVQGEVLALAASEAPEIDAVVDSYRGAVAREVHERYELSCATDDARARRWSGESLDLTKRDGCYPLFSLAGAVAAAPYDDHVLRRTVRRIGLLDRTSVFDNDVRLHDRIESILSTHRPTPPGPPREELLARLTRLVPAASR